MPLPRRYHQLHSTPHLPCHGCRSSIPSRVTPRLAIVRHSKCVAGHSRHAGRRSSTTGQRCDWGRSRQQPLDVLTARCTRRSALRRYRERIIGTAMQMIHDELPGTTFSIPASAASTIPRRWPPDTARAGALVRVGGRHLSRLVHNGSPAAGRTGPRPWAVNVPAVVTCPTAFWSIFCPSSAASLTRTGFCHRPHPLLRRRLPWIARRDRLTLPDPARSARHQPHLGWNRRAALPGNSLPYLVAPGCHPLGTTAGAGEIAAARARTGG